MPILPAGTSAINAKAALQSNESMKEAEEMMRALEAPDVVAYKTRELKAFRYCPHYW